MQAAQSRAAAEQRPSKEASWGFKQKNTKTPNGCKRGEIGGGSGSPRGAARPPLLPGRRCSMRPAARNTELTAALLEL